MTLLGVVFLLMGNWFLLPWFVATGAICEAIMWKAGSFENPKRLTAAWTAASLLYNGVNILPIWFFWDSYYSFAIASGMEQGYIDSYTHYYGTPGWLVFIVLFTTACGFIGCLIGQKLIKKHFKKAGLGLLVVFRFFPTMKAELRGIRQSMRNRGLTGIGYVARHPASAFEYILAPTLLRCLQIADQLSVSAVARGAETPGKRGSYCGKPVRVRDYACMAVWACAAAALLLWGAPTGNAFEGGAL
jgi:energy-coupling factor transporter transmembrane protein EcfT